MGYGPGLNEARAIAAQLTHGLATRSGAPGQGTRSPVAQHRVATAVETLLLFCSSSAEDGHVPCVCGHHPLLGIYV